MSDDYKAEEIDHGTSLIQISFKNNLIKNYYSLTTIEFIYFFNIKYLLNEKKLKISLFIDSL